MAAEQPFARADYAVEAAPRQRWPLWRPRRRTWLAGGGAVAVALALLVVLNSPLLEVRAVSVRGLRTLSEEAVVQLAALRGENILLADLGAARQRLLALPLIKDASLERRWPNRVRITVVERAPWARWEADGRVWAIDSEGVVLEGLAAPADSTVVRQVSSLPAVRGGARVDPEAVALIRAVQERGPPALGPAILTFEWSRRSGLTIVTQHGRITFGDSDGFAYKYQVWEQLEAEARRRGEPLLQADLRFGTRPFVEIGLGLGRAPRLPET